jgi:hypothetical protein
MSGVFLIGRGPQDSDVPIEVTEDGSLKVEPLGRITISRQLNAGASSSNTALSTTCRRISMRATGADIRFSIGSSSQTAASSSHFIANGERLDFAVPSTPNIAVIRAGTTDGILELSELL